MKCYSSRKTTNTWVWDVVTKVLVSFACDPATNCPVYKVSHLCAAFFQIAEEFLG